MDYHGNYNKRLRNQYNGLSNVMSKNNKTNAFLTQERTWEEILTSAHIGCLYMVKGGCIFLQKDPSCATLQYMTEITFLPALIC